MWDRDECELLALAIGNADCVIVAAGPTYDPKHRASNTVLARATDRQSVLDMQHALETGPGPRMDWMTPGDVTIAFLLHRVLLAAVKLLAPDYIRCEELWVGDAPLADPATLQAWFRGHGLDLTD